MRGLEWPRPWWLGGVALLALVFGGLTLKEGGSVLLVDGEARRLAGNYVSFVVWFNSIAGFAYIVAGVGAWQRRPWAVWLSFALAGATLLVFSAFGVHILEGGAYELRTAGAMALRTGFWLAVSLVLRHTLHREPSAETVSPS
jgi:hypothetical protein